MGIGVKNIGRQQVKHTTEVDDMMNSNKTRVKGDGQRVKTDKNNTLTQLADVKVGWLKILRDEVADFEVCSRHINKLDIELQNYYQGKPEAGVDYIKKIKLRRELKERQTKELGYIETILDEVNNLDSTFNAIIITYLKNPDLSIRGVAAELEITHQEVLRTLERYNRELEGKGKGLRTTEVVRDFIKDKLSWCLI